ncbi:PilZ domain-containing protein [Bacillus sp. Brlt_9]|uniref:PilZ domain-containing protein n=1 Tax=Bacillus sp. Brlt_9 TaxID=3110916 RepID=UPI003F7C7FFE
MENRREFYRLSLFGEEDITIVYSGGKAIGKVIDLSATGVSFETYYEINFKIGVVEFEINDVKFSRKIELIRKKSLESGRTFYATHFVEFTEADRKLLFQKLLQLDARKRLGTNMED